MLGQSGFMICLGCFKSHHNGLFSVGHGQTDTILGGDGHQSLLYFKSPSRVASGSSSTEQIWVVDSRYQEIYYIIVIIVMISIWINTALFIPLVLCPSHGVFQKPCSKRIQHQNTLLGTRIQKHWSEPVKLTAEVTLFNCTEQRYK